MTPRFVTPRNLRTGPLLVLAVLAALVGRGALADDADDQYDVATGLYAQKQWKLAVKEFTLFLKQFPNDPRANRCGFFLGEAQLQSGQFGEALERFRDYLKREPQGQLARSALFRSGEAAYLGGQLQQATGPLREFLTKYPDDERGAYALPYLGDIALAEKRFAAAEKDYREGLARFPQGTLQDDCRLGLGRALERQGNRDEALRLYMAVAGKTGSPLADDAQFQLGALQYSMGKYADAVKAFEQFETKFQGSPRRPTARLGRGWSLIKLQQMDEALALFTDLSSDPKLGFDARYWIGMIRREKKDWATAAKTLLELAEAAPKHALISSIRFHAGDALLRAGDLAGAQKQFDAVMAAGGANDEWVDDALRGKVQAALEANEHGQIDKLAADFLKRFSKSPLAGDVAQLRGRSLLERKDHDQASKVLEPLAKRGGQDRQALENHYLLALAYEGLKRHDDALTQLAPVLESAVGQLKADAQLVEASVHTARQQFSKAVAPLEAFLAAHPTGEEAIRAKAQLAVCFAHGNQLDQAKRAYADLVARHADHKLMAPTTEQLAEAAFAAGDWDWSGRLFTRLADAGQTAERQSKGLSGLGWSQLKAGQLAEAAATFDKLLAKAPPEPLAAEVALVRGQILEKLNLPDPALAMYDRVIDRYPKSEELPKALLSAARLCHKLKQNTRAAKLYEQWVAAQKQSAEMDKVLYEWAWVLDDLDRKDDSSNVFERIHEDHAKSPYWADATYRLAERAFGNKDPARAGALVAKVLAGAAPAKVREHALGLQGQIAADGQKWDEVRTAFQTLLKEYPRGRFRTEAEFWIAETFFRRGDYAAAGKLLDELARRTQGEKAPWMAMIDLRRAQVLGHLKKWNEAYAMAAKIQTEYPKFEQMYEVDYLLGRCLANRAEFDEARRAYTRAIRSEHGALTETAAKAQLMIGESRFHQKDYELAQRAYLLVAFNYDYPPQQAAALLQAAKCSEKLGEWGEAVKFYGQLLKDFADSPVAQDARKCLPAARQHAETTKKD